MSIERSGNIQVRVNPCRRERVAQGQCLQSESSWVSYIGNGKHKNEFMNHRLNHCQAVRKLWTSVLSCLGCSETLSRGKHLLNRKRIKVEKQN